MNTNFTVLKGLRVYNKLTALKLANLILCNRVARSKFLTSNAEGFHQLASIFPGRWITNSFLHFTYTKLFTAGSNLEALRKTNIYLASQGIPVIVSYCWERVDIKNNQELILDRNARGFTSSAFYAAQQPDNSISIRISALFDQNLFHKYNQSILLRDKLWRQSSQNGVMVPQKLFEGFQKLYAGVTEEDFVDYLKKIHGFSGSNPSQCKIDEVDFKMNHQPFFLFQREKNEVLLTKLLFPVDHEQQRLIDNFTRRLKEILSRQYRNPNNLRVIVNAEQANVQTAIDSIVFQLEEHYNKERLYIIPTIQSYLKQSQRRVQFQLEVSKRKGFCFGTVLVRGLYLDQQNVNCQKGKSQSLIEKDSSVVVDKYLSNFQQIANFGVGGEVIIATHDSQIIDAVLSVKKENSKGLKISFAHFYGMGDHLTTILNQQGQTVYKQLPWGSKNSSVPYLLRRGQMLSRSTNSLDTQYSLLLHELRLSLFGQ